jgi:hypothetical protein
VIELPDGAGFRLNFDYELLSGDEARAQIAIFAHQRHGIHLVYQQGLGGIGGYESGTRSEDREFIDRILLPHLGEITSRTAQICGSVAASLRTRVPLLTSFCLLLPNSEVGPGGPEPQCYGNLLRGDLMAPWLSWRHDRTFLSELPPHEAALADLLGDFERLAPLRTAALLELLDLA